MTDILCINDSFTAEQISEIPNRPIKDKMYTVRDVVKSRNGVGLLLNEIHNPKDAGWTMLGDERFTFEPNFSIKRFADLQGQPLLVEELSNQNVEV